MSTPRPPVVPRAYFLPFVLLTVCFAAWGLANNMTDPLVKVFSRIFTMTNLQGALVQFSFYGAYFCLAFPAALLIKRFTYKAGVLTGLGLFILGALLFYPASLLQQYWSFLLAIYVLAAGLSVLETSANPFILALGPEETATQRLNLAQAFNPVGSNLGVFLAGVFILSQVHPATEAERQALAVDDPAALTAIQSAELAAVMGPYVGVAVVLLVLWIALAVTPMPRLSEPARQLDVVGTLGRLVRHRHYVFGVIAQFFYVAAQICVWTFIIQYGVEVLGFTEKVAGHYLQAAVLAFLVFRFICTFLMRIIRPGRLLLGFAAAAALLCLYAILVPGWSGLLALVGVSACMALMFPTIYGIALEGLGEDSKIGAAGLVMAILGGALLPLLQAALIDLHGAAFSYLVPLVCFVVVAAFAWFDVRRPVVARQ